MKVFIFLAGLLSSFILSAQEPWQYMIKFTPTKLLVHEIMFSMEARKANHALETEISYIWPAKDPESNSNPGIEWNSFPLFYYNGMSLHLVYKTYIRRFYFGPDLIYKYQFFDNKWVWTGGMSGDYYAPDIFCSQVKHSFGPGMRIGGLYDVHGFIIEPYFAVGLRFIYTETDYHYWKSGGTGERLNPGKPQYDEVKPQEGLTLFPVVNAGMKIGINFH